MSKNKGGRPKLSVNWDAIDQLCKLNAPANEIADYISVTESKVSYDTLDRRAKEEFGLSFAEYVKQKTNALAKPRLRQLQWRCAEGGNASMLIWLGKQYLAQTDKVENPNQETGNNVTFVIKKDEL